MNSTIRNKLKEESIKRYAKMKPKERVALAIELSYLAREFHLGVLKVQQNKNHESFKKRLSKTSGISKKTTKRKSH